MPPIKTKTSVGLETPDQTVERANKLLQPTISASDLTTPTTPVTVPEPQVGSLPQGTSQIVSNVTRDMNGFIAAQTQEAADLKKRQQEYAQLTNQGSLQDLFTSTMEGAGVNQKTLKELKDIQLQLADNKTASELTKTQIAGADGQTLVQGQREITQEDREAAVRSTGLAARASVIQGNIETATQLARDTVNIAYQDRTLTSQNLLNQIEMLQGQVDDQTGQLLEQEKRQYEADLAAVEELKRATQNAIVSGASQSEITQLTDPNVDDQTKLQLAQSITARGATEMRNLDIRQAEANLANTYSQIDSRNLDDLIKKAEKGDQAAIDKLGFNPKDSTGNFEAESSLRKEFNGLKVVQDATQIQNSFNQINSAYQQALDATVTGESKAAADQALIISFNKMLDPGSVVREGEFARSTEGQSLINQWKAKADQVINGGAGITDAERASIVNLTRVLYSDYIQTHNDKAYEYRQNALRQGGDPSYVASYMDTVGLTAQAAQEGDVIIKGGQPYQKQGDQMVPLEI